MMQFCSLNESSSEAEEEEFGQKKTKEAEESENVALYHSALGDQHAGRYGSAEGKYRRLLDSHLLDDAQPEEGVDIQTNPSLYLKYLAFKNMAQIKQAQGDLVSAMSLYTEASLLDTRDVLMWLSMARLARQQDNLVLARCALEAGLQANPSYWPCIDMLLDVLFELGDHSYCLEVVDKALLLDPAYAKGWAVRDRLLAAMPPSVAFMLTANSPYRPPSQLKRNQHAASLDALVDARRKRYKQDLAIEEQPKDSEAVIAAGTWRALGHGLLSLLDTLANGQDTLVSGRVKIVLENGALALPAPPVTEISGLPSAARRPAPKQAHKPERASGRLRGGGRGPRSAPGAPAADREDMELDWSFLPPKLLETLVAARCPVIGLNKDNDVTLDMLWTAPAKGNSENAVEQASAATNVRQKFFPAGVSDENQEVGMYVEGVNTGNSGVFDLLHRYALAVAANGVQLGLSPDYVEEPPPADQATSIKQLQDMFLHAHSLCQDYMPSTIPCQSSGPLMSVVDDDSAANLAGLELCLCAAEMELDRHLSGSHASSEPDSHALRGHRNMLRHLVECRFFDRDPDGLITKVRVLWLLGRYSMACGQLQDAAACMEDCAAALALCHDSINDSAQRYHVEEQERLKSTREARLVMKQAARKEKLLAKKAAVERARLERERAKENENKNENSEGISEEREGCGGGEGSTETDATAKVSEVEVGLAGAADRVDSMDTSAGEVPVAEENGVSANSPTTRAEIDKPVDATAAIDAVEMETSQIGIVGHMKQEEDGESMQIDNSGGKDAERAHADEAEKNEGKETGRNEEKENGNTVEDTEKVMEDVQSSDVKGENKKGMEEEEATETKRKDSENEEANEEEEEEEEEEVEIISDVPSGGPVVVLKHCVHDRVISGPIIAARLDLFKRLAQAKSAAGHYEKGEFFEVVSILQPLLDDPRGMTVTRGLGKHFSATDMWVQFRLLLKAGLALKDTPLVLRTLHVLLLAVLPRACPASQDEHRRSEGNGEEEPVRGFWMDCTQECLGALREVVGGPSPVSTMVDLSVWLGLAESLIKVVGWVADSGDMLPTPVHSLVWQCLFYLLYHPPGTSEVYAATLEMEGSVAWTGWEDGSTRASKDEAVATFLQEAHDTFHIAQNGCTSDGGSFLCFLVDAARKHCPEPLPPSFQIDRSDNEPIHVPLLGLYQCLYGVSIPKMKPATHASAPIRMGDKHSVGVYRYLLPYLLSQAGTSKPFSMSANTATAFKKLESVFTEWKDIFNIPSADISFDWDASEDAQATSAQPASSSTDPVTTDHEQPTAMETTTTTTDHSSSTQHQHLSPPTEPPIDTTHEMLPNTTGETERVTDSQPTVAMETNEGGSIDANVTESQSVNPPPPVVGSEAEPLAMELDTETKSDQSAENEQSTIKPQPPASTDRESVQTSATTPPTNPTSPRPNTVAAASPPPANSTSPPPPEPNPSLPVHGATQDFGLADNAPEHTTTKNVQEMGQSQPSNDVAEPVTENSNTSDIQPMETDNTHDKDVEKSITMQGIERMQRCAKAIGRLMGEAGEGEIPEPCVYGVDKEGVLSDFYYLSGEFVSATTPNVNWTMDNINKVRHCYQHDLLFHGHDLRSWIRLAAIHANTVYSTIYSGEQRIYLLDEEIHRQLLCALCCLRVGQRLASLQGQTETQGILASQEGLLRYVACARRLDLGLAPLAGGVEGSADYRRIVSVLEDLDGTAQCFRNAIELSGTHRDKDQAWPWDHYLLGKILWKMGAPRIQCLSALHQAMQLNSKPLYSYIIRYAVVSVIAKVLASPNPPPLNEVWGHVQEYLRAHHESQEPEEQPAEITLERVAGTVLELLQGCERGTKSALFHKALYRQAWLLTHFEPCRDLNAALEKLQPTFKKQARGPLRFKNFWRLADTSGDFLKEETRSIYQAGRCLDRPGSYQMHCTRWFELLFEIQQGLGDTYAMVGLFTELKGGLINEYILPHHYGTLASSTLLKTLQALQREIARLHDEIPPMNAETTVTINITTASSQPPTIPITQSHSSDPSSEQPMNGSDQAPASPPPIQSGSVPEQGGDMLYGTDTTSPAKQPTDTDVSANAELATEQGVVNQTEDAPVDQKESPPTRTGTPPPVSVVEGAKEESVSGQNVNRSEDAEGAGEGVDDSAPMEIDTAEEPSNEDADKGAINQSDETSHSDATNQQKPIPSTQKPSEPAAPPAPAFVTTQKAVMRKGWAMWDVGPDAVALCRAAYEVRKTAREMQVEWEKNESDEQDRTLVMAYLLCARHRRPNVNEEVEEEGRVNEEEKGGEMEREKVEKENVVELEGVNEGEQKKEDGNEGTENRPETPREGPNENPTEPPDAQDIPSDIQPMEIDETTTSAREVSTTTNTNTPPSSPPAPAPISQPLPTTNEAPPTEHSAGDIRPPIASTATVAVAPRPAPGPSVEELLAEAEEFAKSLPRLEVLQRQM